MLSISRSTISRFRLSSNSRCKETNHGLGKRNQRDGDKFWSELSAEPFSTIFLWSWSGSRGFATCITGKYHGIWGQTQTNSQDWLKYVLTFWSYWCVRIFVSTLLTDFFTTVYYISTYTSSIMRLLTMFPLLLWVAIQLNSWFQIYTHLFQELCYWAHNCTLCL